MTTQSLPQWEKDLLTSRMTHSLLITTDHTCLTPRGRAPYVCLRVKIMRVPYSDLWHLFCLEPGCSHTTSAEIANDLADLGRIHVANHGGRP